MKIDPTGKTAKLAAQVILEARKDLRKPECMVEAALWFMGQDFPFWAEVANVPFANPFMVFRELKPFTARVLLSKFRNMSVSEIPDGYTRKQFLKTKNTLVPLLYGVINQSRAAEGNKQHGSQVRNSQ